ncbi:hypothetical protein LCGC14_0970220 [marine sediment metagenome]|uniref:Uncharacterized protein n=1 Tax=marine sediment metagenome TaxID=412755 RepID=A0A0F9NGD7_9ZZZZ
MTEFEEILEARNDANKCKDNPNDFAVIQIEKEEYVLTTKQQLECVKDEQLKEVLELIEDLDKCRETECCSESKFEELKQRISEGERT